LALGPAERAPPARPGANRDLAEAPDGLDGHRFRCRAGLRRPGRATSSSLSITSSIAPSAIQVHDRQVLSFVIVADACPMRRSDAVTERATGRAGGHRARLRHHAGHRVRRRRNPRGPPHHHHASP
jgi:hypothetical protein